MTVAPLIVSIFLGAFPEFRRHEVHLGLPVPGGVGDYGQTALADLDGDGDLDFVLGRKGGGDANTVYWFEYRGPGDWAEHVVGHDSRSDVGLAALDVDRDGRVDLVCSGVWYRNPGDPRTREFARHVFDEAGDGAHDVVAADIDRDGRPDVATMVGGKDGLRWYRIGDDPTKPWRRVVIGDGVHAAIAPAGVGDLDGDGDPDVVRANGWFENADGRGTAWAWHRNIPFGKEGGYGMAVRCQVVDLDGDGDRDLVMTDNDIAASDAAWIENVDGRGLTWAKHPLPMPDGPGRDFHSLAVADLDGDGDPDVFTCEMDDERGRFFAWENLDGKAARFERHVLLDARLGGHEAQVGDVDGDGDLDICSKPWTPMPGNAVGGKMHVDYLENLRRR